MSETGAFPPGMRFCPYDGELIVHYLQKKINNEWLSYNKIQDVNIYEYNPDCLTDQYEELREGIWYFFSPRERIYPNGKRPKRAAGDGYWKATGADKPVEHEGVIVGKKKALVFYLGKPPKGNKTDWLMQEYTIDAPPRIKQDEHDMRLDDWVLCKIYKRAPGKLKKGGQGEQDEQIAVTETSPEEEVAQYDDNLVGMNNDSDIGNSIQQPSLISELPPFPDFYDYYNFAAYSPQQQQVVNFPVQSVGYDPNPMQGFGMSNYSNPENLGQHFYHGMGNLVSPHQLPHQLKSMDPLS